MATQKTETQNASGLRRIYMDIPADLDTAIAKFAVDERISKKAAYELILRKQFAGKKK